MEINIELKGDCQASLDRQHLTIETSMAHQGFHEYTMNKLVPGTIKLTYVDSATWEKLRLQHEASCRNSMGFINEGVKS